MNYPVAESKGEFMFAAYRNPARAYAGVAMETSVAAAYPVDLVVLLYEGAMEGIVKAIAHMRERDFAAKGKAITHVIRIIDEGLRASLDERGGDLTNQLSDLYGYMTVRLLQGSLKNDPEALTEVRNLLLDLKGAWDELARNTHAGTQPAQAATARMQA